MQPVVIVVPVYKSFDQLDDGERYALQQLKQVLAGFPLVMITGENFDVEGYEIFFEHKVETERFDDSYFQSVKGYNQLCLSTLFYQRFEKYEYMLIYQTDAFVFANELEYWIQQGFDFIGAPYHTDNSQPFDATIWTVGNGGFSLRSISKCKQLVEKIYSYQSKLQLLEKIGLKRFVTKALIKLHVINLAIIDGILRNRFNEDYVFGVLSKDLMKDFRVAPLEKAIAFSFEAHPSLLYKLNQNTLPFGCHSWERYEPEFWRQFIPVEKRSVASH